MGEHGEIYKIVNKKNQSTILYIGSTTTDLKTRWQKHLSHSKRYQNTPFYNELYNNGELYEIQSICNVYYNNKSELLAREGQKIEKYKPLANIIRGYKNLENTADTDSDSDTESRCYCREDSYNSEWDTDNDLTEEQDLLTEEQILLKQAKDNKYYTWGCGCSGGCCDCKYTERNYEKWHLEYPEMYNHKYTDKEYIFINKTLKECINGKPI
jgi:predicted GIY-YIG superfamily endonuclease